MDSKAKQTEMNTNIKLLDLDCSSESSRPDDTTEDVPVHLFLSPSHSAAKGRISSSSSNETRHRRTLKETTFVEKKEESDDEISSASVSPLTISSGATSPVNRARNLRRTNKIHDVNSVQQRDDREDTTTPVSDTDYVSEHISYKDRLRDHINNIRDRAAESVSRPTSRSQSRMKLLMASRTSRADDVLKREEREVSLAMERHQKLRGQWRQLSEEILRRKAEKEGYEFFVHEEDIAIDGPVEEPISPALTEKSRDGKIAVTECLDLKPDWEPVIWIPAQLAMEKINQFIFYPSSRPVALEDKLEDGFGPRFIEEEGLYVETKGKRSSRRKTRLEQRLLKTPNGKKWFGPDGELLAKPSKLIFSLEIHSTVPKGVYYQYPTLPTFQRNLDKTHVVLDFELLSVRFLHHWLFSREHLLAQRLKELFRRYRQLRHTDSCRRLKGQLDALRRARDKNNRLDNDIKDVREKWLAESKLERLVENRLLATWRDLQRLRDEQGFRNTSIQVDIKHKPGIGLDEWEKEILNEIAEAKMEALKNYKVLKIKYDEEYDKWRKSMSGNEEEENYEEIRESVPPPDPIPPVDENAIEQNVREIFRICFKGPNEPEFELALADLGPPTATSDTREDTRRTLVKKQQISVKLLCNGKEVYKSEDEHISSVFTIKFGHRFAVRLLEWPKSLSLEIVEGNRWSCNVFLPFPDSMSTIERVDVSNSEFSSTAVITCNHAGIGCGREIVAYPGGSEYNTKPEISYISGIVSCRLGWAVDGMGRILAPPSHFWNQKERDLRRNELQTHSDVTKLRDWVVKARLDPNDPTNAQLFHVLSQTTSQPIEQQMDNEWDFCDAAELENNPRLRLLRLRDQGEPEFRGFQMVPLSEKMIHPDIFKAYEARVARPVEQETVVDPLDCHRALGRRRLEQIRQNVLQKCRQARQHRRLADIVSEEQVPDLGTLGLTLMRWLRPKRPLRPERKQRKKVPVQTISGQGVSIVVNVVRAFEVPVRKDMDSLSATESIDGFSLVNVRPFVFASFRGESARTTAAEGANPTWNQDLILPVHTSTGEYSPGALAGMKDTLFLHLFDEVVVDLVEEDSLRDTTIHQRLERHWLAGLEIPFSTLYCNSRVEGTFQLYSPPVLLGYEREAHRVAGGSLPQRDATYLTVFITVQPALNPPEPFLDNFSTSETPALETHLRGWQSQVQSLFPNRKIYSLVSTSTATAVCITRLVRPIAPPLLPGLENGSTATAAAIARFVARIPTITSATLFPGLLDVWLTCDQVFEMLSGDAEDHAVILCCFLLHIGLPAYLLLGVGIPHGASAYVLINIPGKEVIWDPTTGCKYSVRDSFCPLHKVYCLVNSINIWANIQEDDSPRRVRFDTKKRADWLPAFNKNMSPPVDSIQPETLLYKETSKMAVQALQDKLENRLRDGMMKWRRRQRTQWNRYCAATMRKLLPRLEEATWDIGDPVSPDHLLGLNHILASHKICGFPINMAYTDMDAVMEAVKATGVHSTDCEDVEFALAVYIYPYPGDVLSVWVYVAALTRRR